MHPHVLARCINAAYSDLVLGEYYLITDGNRLTAPNTAIHQGNVHATLVPTSEMKSENFVKIGDLYNAKMDLIGALKEKNSQTISTPRFRFELLWNESQFLSAVERAKDRESFAKSA